MTDYSYIQEEKDFYVPLWFLLLEYVLVLGFAIGILRIVNDDVFITLRYARNMLHMKGFVYTPGEYVMGITNPLLAFLQAIFSLPMLGNVLLGNYLLQYCLLTGCIILAHIYFQESLMTVAFIPLFFFNSQTLGYFGNETALVYFLILASLICLNKGWDKLFALFLSLLYLARFDGFVFGIAATLFWLMKQKPMKRKIVLQHILLWAFFPILWHLFAYFYYGHFFPNSVTAKILNTGNMKDYLTVLWEKHLPQQLLGSSTLFKGVLVLAGLVVTFRKMSVVLVWFGLFSLLYGILQVPGIYVWYYHPFTLLLILCLAGGVAVFSRKLLSNFWHILWFGFLLSILLVAVHPDASWLNHSWEKQRYQLFVNVAQQLKPIVKPGERMELNEIGILGYYLNTPVLDEHYLVTPQGSETNRFPPLTQLREIYQPKWILINPYRELTTEELSTMHPGYIYRTWGHTADNSVRLYLFEKQ